MGQRPAFPPQTDCLVLDRSTAAELSWADCKQCCLRSDVDDNPAPRPRYPLQQLRVLRCRFHFRHSFKSGSILGLPPLRIG